MGAWSRLKIEAIALAASTMLRDSIATECEGIGRSVWIRKRLEALRSLVN